ncbi:GIY-YIG nuclease family protein [Candidatus Nomurabacteria bacterium]|nr:GIY-YIG nuclease family protein [Candidatus Nomurabacteria bacterium]
MKKYHVYLARCKDNSLYTGYTVNLKDREAKHNVGEGAKYTKARRPVKIIYSEEFKTISEAMQREAEIKTWTKAQKEKLLKNLL